MSKTNFNNKSSTALMNRTKLSNKSTPQEVADDKAQMQVLKKKRRKEAGHDVLGKKLCSQEIPLMVSYSSWRDTNKFSDAYEKTMIENNADSVVRSAKVNIYGKSGLSESHINSITNMSKTLGEKKLLSAFVKSGKNQMNKVVIMNILAQAKLYVASLMTDNDKKTDGDRGEKDEQDLSFINNANQFLTKLFSLDSIIEEEDLPPLFFTKAIFKAFALDTPVCNKFNLIKLYVDKDDVAHRVLLWRVFQAEALYAVFSRFALTLAKGSGFAAELVEVIDRAASSYRVYYRYYYCGGCWYWASYAVAIPEIKHVEFQGKDAPGLRVIMNSLLINVNTQAQSLLDYDSVVQNQVILMKDTIQEFMDSNFELEIRILFKSFDSLFNTAKKMGLLMDDIEVVTLELDHCIKQINAVSYSNVSKVLNDHRNTVISFENKRRIKRSDYNLNGANMTDSIKLYKYKVGKMYEDHFDTAFFSVFNIKGHISDYNSNDKPFAEDAKHAAHGISAFLRTKRDLIDVYREAGISSLLGFVVGKVVDLTTRSRVSMADVKSSEEARTQKDAQYNSLVLSLRDELADLKS